MSGGLVRLEIGSFIRSRWLRTTGSQTSCDEGETAKSKQTENVTP